MNSKQKERLAFAELRRARADHQRASELLQVARRRVDDAKMRVEFYEAVRQQLLSDPVRP